MGVATLVRTISQPSCKGNRSWLLGMNWSTCVFGERAFVRPVMCDSTPRTDSDSLSVSAFVVWGLLPRAVGSSLVFRELSKGDPSFLVFPLDLAEAQLVTCTPVFDSSNIKDKIIFN